MQNFELIQNKNSYELLIDNQSLCKLLPVPEGTFTMGDNNSKYDDEKPERQVKVNNFYMAQFPVTQELYELVTKSDEQFKGNSTPSRFQSKNHPVETVSWYDAIEFCDILNKALKIETSFYTINKKLEDKNNENKYDEKKWTVNFNRRGKGFRLPTEAEWEYAAQYNKNPMDLKNLYAGSNTLDMVGWYEKNNYYETKPVGLKFPNTLGLYDMSGNVWEWCWDWYAKYDANMRDNPIGANSGTNRVYRGGSWRSYAVDSRSAYRYYWHPVIRYDLLGFRLVFVP